MYWELFVGWKGSKIEILKNWEWWGGGEKDTDDDEESDEITMRSTIKLRKSVKLIGLVEMYECLLVDPCVGSLCLKLS